MNEPFPECSDCSATSTRGWCVRPCRCQRGQILPCKLTEHGQITTTLPDTFFFFFTFPQIFPRWLEVRAWRLPCDCVGAPWSRQGNPAWSPAQPRTVLSCSKNVRPLTRARADADAAQLQINRELPDSIFTMRNTTMHAGSRRQRATLSLPTAPAVRQRQQQ